MHFILYTCCKIVSGYKQSMIYDLQRCRYLPLPNELATLLTSHNNTIDLDSWDDDTSDSIKAFCENMVANDFGFFYENPSEFVSLPLDYETPSLIKNAVIVLNEANDYLSIYTQLNELGCETITWVIKQPCSPDFLTQQLTIAEAFDFLFVEAICLFSVKKAWLDNLIQGEPPVLLKRIICYYTGTPPFEDFSTAQLTIYAKKASSAEKHNPREEFAVNYTFYKKLKPFSI